MRVKYTCTYILHKYYLKNIYIFNNNGGDITYGEYNSIQVGDKIKNIIKSYLFQIVFCVTIQTLAKGCSPDLLLKNQQYDNSNTHASMYTCS